MPDYINILGLMMIVVCGIAALYYTIIVPIDLRNDCNNRCIGLNANFSGLEFLENETRCWCSQDNLTMQV